MIFLPCFHFPDEDDEAAALHHDYRSKMTCFSSMYPFGVLSKKGLYRMELEPVTLLYGGNGSGKSTALNVIADVLGLKRDTAFNRSDFFEAYSRLCFGEYRKNPAEGRVVTSDDVFDYMLSVRAANEGIDRRREALFEDYWSDRRAGFQVRSLEDFERLRQVNLARSQTPSKYMKARLMENVREQSNGESAAFYFTSRIRDNGLYLLDEPENSLSPVRQIELAEFLENQARFFGCQFIIATHSPFLLSMRGAKIYDLDAEPAAVCRWTELPAVRAYYDFFKKHAESFEKTGSALEE